jgi:hypothetical protein
MTTASSDTPPPGERLLDRRKLRDAIRGLGDEYVFYMLHDALELLPDHQLEKLVGRYLRVDQLREQEGSRGAVPLLSQVRTFDRESRAGKYYEDFRVNSGNCTMLSTGTRAFIVECHRLLDACVERVTREEEPGETCEAFELIFGLLRYIDECHDDVLFFADEGGAWQVEVRWEKVLPSWLSCLARVASPEDYATRVVTVLEGIDEPLRPGQLRAALDRGSPDQRTALAALTAERWKRWL